MGLFRRAPPLESDRWIVVGLGNPGDRYARTRHNAGAMALEVLLRRAGAALKRHKSGCLIAEATPAGARAVLARPTSHMNDSGRQVGELARWYKLSSDRLIVVHDELDIRLGDVRIKRDGGTAGHNGVASIVSQLRTKDFLRVRIGVSRPPGRQDPVDYVLGEFSSGQRKELPFVLEAAADAVERILEVGAERAMNEVNTKA